MVGSGVVNEGFGPDCLAHKLVEITEEEYKEKLT